MNDLCLAWRLSVKLKSLVHAKTLGNFIACLSFYFIFKIAAHINILLTLAFTPLKPARAFANSLAFSNLANSE